MSFKYKITSYPKRAPSAKAWMWRLLLGPASIVETATFGFYAVTVKLTVSRYLALARIQSKPNTA